MVATYDRNFIERSGAQTLQELLDTGINCYFLTGGQDLLVLVNGRPYASTGSDLEPLPLSAVERIEVLGGESLGSVGGTARGALNIVLRTSLDGFETRTVTRAPSREGGDGWQGSAFWGGSFGEKGRMTLGVDVIDRQKSPAASGCTAAPNGSRTASSARRRMSASAAILPLLSSWIRRE